MNKLKILPIFLILSFGLVFNFVSAVCTESDSGVDYFNKGDLYKDGEIIFDETAQGDYNVDSSDEVVVLSSTTARLRLLNGSWIDLVLNGEYDFEFGEGKVTEVNFISADNRQNSIKIAYTRLEDMCFDNMLIERSCGQSGDHSTSYECPIACSNGACIEEIEEDECTDTDGGKNYNVRGVAANNQDSAGDSCVGITNWDVGYTVIESYCDNDGNVQQEEYECPVMCRSGACIDEEREFRCEDSDGSSPTDQNYNEKGTVKVYFGDELLGSESDVCQGNSVIEKYCSTSSYSIVGVENTCPRGCKDGACVTVCLDTDSGVDYYNKGEIYQDGEIIFDETIRGSDEVEVLSSTNAKLKLMSGNWINVELNGIYDFGFGEGKVTEINFISEGDSQNNVRIAYTRLEDYCSGNTLIERDCNQAGDHSTSFDCKLCMDGACLNKTVVKPNITEGPEEISDFEKYYCFGCLVEKSCYPLGYRKSGEYCSENKSFTPQLKEDLTCENNFECSSNLCIDNQCVSGGFWQRLMSWFKNLFG